MTQSHSTNRCAIELRKLIERDRSNHLFFWDHWGCIFVSWGTTLLSFGYPGAPFWYPVSRRKTASALPHMLPPAKSKKCCSQDGAAAHQNAMKLPDTVPPTSAAGLKESPWPMSLHANAGRSSHQSWNKTRTSTRPLLGSHHQNGWNF